MKFVKIDPVITVQTEEMQVQSDCAKDHSNEVILIDSNVDGKLLLFENSAFILLFPL